VPAAAAAQAGERRVGARCGSCEGLEAERSLIFRLRGLVAPISTNGRGLCLLRELQLCCPPHPFPGPCSVPQAGAATSAEQRLSLRSRLGRSSGWRWLGFQSQMHAGSVDLLWIYFNSSALDALDANCLPWNGTCGRLPGAGKLFCFRSPACCHGVAPRCRAPWVRRDGRGGFRAGITSRLSAGGDQRFPCTQTWFLRRVPIEIWGFWGVCGQQSASFPVAVWEKGRPKFLRSPGEGTREKPSISLWVKHVSSVGLGVLRHGGRFLQHREAARLWRVALSARAGPHPRVGDLPAHPVTGTGLSVPFHVAFWARRCVLLFAVHLRPAGHPRFDCVKWGEMRNLRHGGLASSAWTQRRGWGCPARCPAARGSPGWAKRRGWSRSDGASVLLRWLLARWPSGSRDSGRPCLGRTASVRVRLCSGVPEGAGSVAPAPGLFAASLRGRLPRRTLQTRWQALSCRAPGCGSGSARASRCLARKAGETLPQSLLWCLCCSPQQSPTTQLAGFCMKN